MRKIALRKLFSGGLPSRNGFSLLMAALALLVSIPLFAEGSGDWKRQQTNRQTSLYVPSFTTGNTGYNTRGFMMLPSVRSGGGSAVTAYNNAYDPGHRFYVYVKAGETVYYSFRHSSGASNSFAWYYDSSPAGANERFPLAVGSTRTAISMNGRSTTNGNLTQAQTVAGPSPIAGNAGYSVSGSNAQGGSFTNTTGADRAFWLEFTNSSGFEITDWDVTVASAANTALTGRVYGKYWSMVNGLPGSGANVTPNTSSFHDLFTFFVPIENTEDGGYFVKSINFGGSNAGYVVFFANQWGPINNSTVGENRKSIQGTSNLYQYPLFINDPDEEFWHSSQLASPIMDVVFIRNTPPATGAIGQITVDIEYPGTVDILVDINNNGIKDGTDVVITETFTTPGVHVITWDGKDSNGVDITNGQEITFISTVSFFPVNFPVYDMEQSHGMVFQNIRPGTPGIELLFWDHSGLNQNQTNPSNSWSIFPGQPLVNTTGLLSPDSNNNLWNKWYGTGDNGFGNNRTINTWTGSSNYYQFKTLFFNYDESDLSVLKTVDNENPAIGENVTYTITLRNLGISWASEVEVEDLLPGGLEYVSHTITDDNTPSYNTGYNPNTGVWSIVDGSDLFMPGDILQLHIVAKVTQSGVITNTASIVRGPNAEVDPDPDNNESSVVITVEGTDMIAYNDINQVPQGQTAEGNVLDNDEGDNLSVTEFTYFDENGNSQTALSGDTVTVYDENGNEAGEMTLNPDGTYTFVPHPDFSGTVPVGYTAQDGAGNTDTALLTIEVIPPVGPGPNPPVANNDTQTVGQGGTAVVDVLANDSNPGGDNGDLSVIEVLAYDSNGQPTIPLTNTPQTVYDAEGNLAGTAYVDSDGNIVFEPTPGYTGNVPFEYTIENEEGLTASATATITVVPEDGNDGFLYANDDANSGPKGESMSGNVLNNDAWPATTNDPEVVSAEVTIGGVTYTIIPGTPTTIPGVGEITLNSDGSYTFNPDPDFVGTVPVTYTIEDEDGNTATAVLYLTTLEIDEPEIEANDDVYVIDTGNDPITTPSVFENDTLNGEPFDPDDVDFTIIDDSDLPDGITVNPDGTVTIDPDVIPGAYTFTYQICEVGATPPNCDTAVVTLYVDMCVEEVGGNEFSWDYDGGATTPDPVVETFTQPGSEGGYTLDIFYLDNSFNMEINGTLLATKEIEFQSANTDGINIRFADGDQYETNTDDIWELEGDENHPILRIRINANGSVDMFGVKESFGELYPLVPISGLVNSFTFNYIDWNSDTDNIIIVSQNVVNVTGMSGRGYGINYVACFCVKPGVGGEALTSSVGISTKGAVPTVDGWPQSVPNGYLVLDSAEKGFVITHMTTAQRDALTPVEGMLIYNTDLDCVQMYRGHTPGTDAGRTEWNCLERGCNE